MAEKTALPKSLYALGEGEESSQANQRYEEAYNQLIAAVEKRNQPQFFDPTLLAISQAFLGPTKTGSFGEAAGVAAGNVAKSQEAEQTRAEELAKMRLELAGMGVERATQRGIMQGLAKKAGMVPSGPAAEQAVTEKAPATKSVAPESDMEPIGRFPVNPNLIKNEQDFYRRAIESGQRDPAAIGKEWVQYQKDFLSPRFEGGNVYEPTSGTIYAKRTGDTGTASFMTGEGGNFTLPTPAVMEHQNLIKEARQNPDNPDVWKKIQSFEDFYRQGPRRPVQTTPVAPAAVKEVAPPAAPVSAPAAAPTTAPIAAPVSAPTAAPSAPPRTGGLLSAQEQKEREAQLASQRAIAEAAAKEQDKARIAQAAKTTGENIEDERKTIVDLKKAAIGQRNIADQMAKLVTEYPNAIGTASKPGFLSAGIKILESGANIGGENAKVSALEEAVATLKGTPEELSARRVMMGLAAEYLFNLRSLAKGQGAITDYETRVLSSIGPSLQDDPKTARFKAQVMKMHADAEIERVNDFNKWKEKHQGQGWRDYLASTANDDFQTRYDKKLGMAYDTYLGRKPQPVAQPAAQPSNPALDFARSLKR